MNPYRRGMEALEAYVRRFVAGRSLESALLLGGIVMAVVLAAVSYAANGYFIYAREHADKVRWSAATANIHFLQLREIDGMLLHDDGVEPGALARHDAALAVVAADLAALVELARGEARDLAEQLQAALAAYDTGFRRLAAPGAGAEASYAHGDTHAATVSALFTQIVDRATRDSNYARIAMAVSMGLAALVAVAAATVMLRIFARSLSGPITQLGTTAREIGAGNLDARAPVDSRNEIGQLAATINRMAEELADLVSQVQKSGIQVASSVNEIAATAKEQQATAGETAATTLEIGATAREIAVTSRELVGSVREVSEVADESAALAGTGQAGLTRMEEIMRNVVIAAGAISEKLAVLNEQAGNINQVITTITKVADQTNLLSLNAAIEAEKAGEYGRGFSVVATEIRRLADQTAVATYDIEQIVKQIRTAVAASVTGMGKFSEEVRRGTREVQQVGSQLTQIIHHVQALAPRFEAVHEGMQAQATGADQITQALEQLQDAAQQTVESLRQGGQAIEGLHEVSGGLRSSVSRFRLGT